MLEIKINEANEINLSGRFDASQEKNANHVFEKVTTSSVVNFKDLEYISSAGLGVLLTAQKRLSEKGHGLKLINMSKHIHDIFRYAGFYTIFEIE
jgi:anti-sigma B factor antagonist